MNVATEYPAPALMQLADVYAYATAQAYRPGGGRNPERRVWHWEPDPQWEG